MMTPFPHIVIKAERMAQEAEAERIAADNGKLRLKSQT